MINENQTNSTLAHLVNIFKDATVAATQTDSAVNLNGPATKQVLPGEEKKALKIDIGLCKKNYFYVFGRISFL